MHETPGGGGERMVRKRREGRKEGRKKERKEERKGYIGAREGEMIMLQFVRGRREERKWRKDDSMEKELCTR